MAKFTALNWTPMEVMSTEKMKVLNDNTEWLYRNSARGVHANGTSGAQTRENLKILSGAAHIPADPSADVATVDVQFNGFFSDGCYPNISTGVVGSHSYIHATISGLTSDLPGTDGFRIRVGTTAAGQTLRSTTRIHWIAMGF